MVLNLSHKKSNLILTLDMTMPLSPNELQALDRKLASLTHELAEIASLLRSRYDEADELAALAQNLQADFVILAHQLHRRASASRAEKSFTEKSNIA